MSAETGNGPDGIEGGIAEAAPATLPATLVDPPWLRKPKPPKPAGGEAVIVPGLEAPAGRRIVWQPGEREKWAAVRPYGSWAADQWDDAVQEYLDGRMTYIPTQAGLIAQGPDHLVRPLLAGWRPKVTWDFAHSLQPIVARFELDAWEASFGAAKLNPYGTGAVLLPFLDADVARLMADWLYRLKSAQDLARTWFEWHGTDAVPFLVPDALAKRVGPRRNARHALRLIASVHGAEQVVAAAGVHGGDAAEAIAAPLAAEPEDEPPASTKGLAAVKRPSLPDWADPASLPRLTLRGGAALPDSATRNLIMMLALAHTSQELPGLAEAVDEATAILEPAAAAAFGLGLFEAWLGAGLPGRAGWALTVLGRFGDDEAVRRLTPLIKEWPGQSGHERAARGLDVLQQIGTDVALVHLHGIAQKVKYKGLQIQAQNKLAEVAAHRGLSAEQLADRLVPDFGLEAVKGDGEVGGLTLDYGPRRFVVGFDEQLRPYVTDEDGKRRKTLPKPGSKDDPELAPAAYKRFSALRKDVRTVASDQVVRLESAMVTGRRWTAEEFERFFVRQPLVVHVARRLVWLSDDAGEQIAFRIAEDRRPADADDEAFELPATATVRVVHPLHLGDALRAWVEMFADYEILQPFPQLGRPVHVLPEDERESGSLSRFEGVKVPLGKILGLARTGWQRGAAQDGGLQHWISREAGDHHVVIDLDPGISVGYLDADDVQTLEHVWIGRRPDHYSPNSPVKGGFAQLDPVLLSEVLMDLTALTET